MDILFPAYKPAAFNVMLKPAGPVCNLNCTYCYYLEKKNLYREEKKFHISDDLLEIYTKQYIEANQVPVIYFVWQGGEPMLMGIDFFRRALQLQQKYSNGKKIENMFQTNGTLIDEEFCRFFRDNNFLVGISIDGPGHLHDKFRLTRSNAGSFSKVMESIELLNRFRVEFNTLTVVHKENSVYPLEVYHFLKEIGSGFIQFIPIVERRALDPGPRDLRLVAPDYGKNAEVTEWSLDQEQYGNFLCSIFDEWVRNDVGKYYVQIFDVSLANWAGENPGLCVFTETCGDAVVMEHNGDMYSCDHFVYPQYLLGNIRQSHMSDLMRLDSQVKFGKDKRDRLPRYCFECEYRFACNGECPKHRFIQTPDGQEGLNYLCRSYKKFFRHVHPYMQFMTDELKAKRAPANVMNWVRRMDRLKKENNQGISLPGRNDPCPCGSGLKFKNCHYAQPGFRS
jgi:uncharacterized protein